MSGKLGTTPVDAEPVAESWTAVGPGTNAGFVFEAPSQVRMGTVSTFPGTATDWVSECFNVLQGLVDAAAAPHESAADTPLMTSGSRAGVAVLLEATESEAVSILWGEDAFPALTVDSNSTTRVVVVDSAGAEHVWMSGPGIPRRQLTGSLGRLWQEASEACATTTAGKETLASVALCDASILNTCCAGSEQVANEQAWLGMRSALKAACLGVSLTPTLMFGSPGRETAALAEACTRSALTTTAESFFTVSPPWLPVARVR